MILYLGSLGLGVILISSLFVHHRTPEWARTFQGGTIEQLGPLEHRTRPTCVEIENKAASTFSSRDHLFEGCSLALLCTDATPGPEHCITTSMSDAS